MSERRRRLLLHAWVQTLLVGILAALVVHLGSALFLRFDLTRDQRHSLSQVARETVAELDRPLLARVYFTEGLEAPYHDHRQALLEKLEELRAWSDGQLEIRVTDPTDEETAAEAARFGVRPITYAYRDWDRQEARQVYMGVSFVYGDRQVAVPALPSVERMEYELVRALRSVTGDPEDRQTLAWVTGHGEPDPGRLPEGSPLHALREELQGRFDLRTLPLGDEPVAEDVDVLLVIGPQEALSPVAQLHLDQFVMRGGAAAFFLSGYQPDFERMAPREVPHGLHALLGRWGVRLNRDLLLDRESNEPMVVPVDLEGGRSLVKVSYPLALATTDLDRSHPAVREVPRAVLPFVSSLGVAESLPEGLEAEVWMRSGPTSSAVRGLRSLSPRVLGQPLEGEQPGPQPTMVALSGRFPSFWAERVPPPGPGGAPVLDPAEVVPRSAPTRLVVAGSADMVANNLPLVFNAVDWLVEDPALLEVRTRTSARDRLEPPSAEEALRIKLAVVGLPLLLLGLLGALIAWRTR